MLVGYAAAAVGLCKEEHFCCAKLQSDRQTQEIFDWCAHCKMEGFAGIILVNFKDDLSLSDDSWKILLAHKQDMTVVVVPKGQGESLLQILGSDMTSAPDTLTRFVHVKIFPKKSGMYH